MKIAVLSGKGGTGKTFVAVNLAATAGRGSYIDCDVEEPNGRLFFTPQPLKTLPVTTFVPTFDLTKCDGCRRCVDFCHFHALGFVRRQPRLFADLCHACGGCQLVCGSQAVGRRPVVLGELEIGRWRQLQVITGQLLPGKHTGVPVIRAALQHADPDSGWTFIDCPPGSACPVMESLQPADYCILVAEPTAFGLHNLQMVHQLAQLLQKPCGVVINKAGDTPYQPLEDFCTAYNLPVLARIPFARQRAGQIADGQIAVLQDHSLAQLFAGLLERIASEVTP